MLSGLFLSLSLVISYDLARKSEFSVLMDSTPSGKIFDPLLLALAEGGSPEMREILAPIFLACCTSGKAVHPMCVASWRQRILWVAEAEIPVSAFSVAFTGNSASATHR